MNMFRSAGIVFGAFSLVCVGTASAAASITLTDLGTMLYSDGQTYGYSSSGWAINASGQVAGYGNYRGGGTGLPGWEAFRYSGSLPIQGVGYLSTINNAYPASWGFGINDSGSVVGESVSGADNNLRHAFVTSGSSMIDLGSIAGMTGGTASRAYGVNASGTVVALVTSLAPPAQRPPLSTPTAVLMTRLRPPTAAGRGRWPTLATCWAAPVPVRPTPSIAPVSSWASLPAVPTPITPTPLCDQLPGWRPIWAP